MRFGYWMAKFISKISRNHQIMIEYYRRKGVKIGNGCLICSNVVTREPMLVEIGNNVTLSTNVRLVTHDNCIKLIYKEKSDLFGRISIGDNCFIGENVTMLYGVSLANNIIVAAGAVVTKSFHESNIVIGGNPARKISTWEDLKNKYNGNAISRKELIERLDKDDSFLVRRK